MGRTLQDVAEEIKEKLIEKGLKITDTDIYDDSLDHVSISFCDDGASWVSDAETETIEDTEAIDANCVLISNVVKDVDLKGIDTGVLDHPVDYMFDMTSGGIEGVGYDGEEFMISLKPVE